MLHPEGSSSDGAIRSFQRNFYFERTAILRLKRSRRDHKTAECGNIEGVFYCEEVFAHK